MKQRIIISRQLHEDLAGAIKQCSADKVFILVDETTAKKCLPLIGGTSGLEDAWLIIIKPSDTNKEIETVCSVWQELSHHGATRRSLMINLGGGMVTDLGGFAASTFKRGIKFINIPTTLLAMVDASVGGKTGINFCGLKNEIGVFNNADSVIISTEFLKTSDSDNICSGYAEMLKHGLISDEKHWAELVNFKLLDPDLCELQVMAADSIKVKERIVEEDPHEHGIRKALNLGHTFGHALESLAMRRKRPVLHGYAVAYGIICELYLSCVKMGFPIGRMRQTVSYIRGNYGRYDFTCNDYPELTELMLHDKKNTAGVINFTLLGDIGDIRINQTATAAEINSALDFLREG